MEKIEILNRDVGKFTISNAVVIRGKCPHCNDRVTFRQIDGCVYSRVFKDNSVSVCCEGCSSISVFLLNKNKLYPSPRLDSIKDLPEEIDKYYQEGIRCISADSPNGAVTLFRKAIHSIGIYYDIAKINDDKDLYGIINELHNKGHITRKIRDSLLVIKDIGNDGAHINENEPDMEQAQVLKKLIDMILLSTIITDSSIEFARQKHPKPVKT